MTDQTLAPTLPADRHAAVSTVTRVAGLIEDASVYLLVLVAVVFLVVANPPAWYGSIVTVLVLAAGLSLLAGWLARQSTRQAR